MKEQDVRAIPDFYNPQNGKVKRPERIFVNGKFKRPKWSYKYDFLENKRRFWCKLFPG
jgi:hypothetical protein